MITKSLISLILGITLIGLVSADIVSLNDAGDTELVLIPSEPIEGFFFGDITQNASQGGLSPYEFDSRTVCRLASKIDYKKITGLNALKLALYNETGYLIDQDELGNILASCKITKVFPFYLFLILIIIVLTLLTYYNRKRLLVLMGYHKSKQSKKPDVLRDLPKKTKQ